MVFVLCDPFYTILALLGVAGLFLRIRVSSVFPSQLLHGRRPTLNVFKLPRHTNRASHNPSDIKRIRIDDDFDEITVVDIDYEDEQVTYNITGTFEQDNDKYDFVAEVEMENYKEDDFRILSVTKQ